MKPFAISGWSLSKFLDPVRSKSVTNSHFDGTASKMENQIVFCWQVPWSKNYQRGGERKVLLGVFISYKLKKKAQKHTHAIDVEAAISNRRNGSITVNFIDETWEIIGWKFGSHCTHWTQRKKSSTATRCTSTRTAIFYLRNGTGSGRFDTIGHAHFLRKYINIWRRLIWFSRIITRLAIVGQWRNLKCPNNLFLWQWSRWLQNIAPDLDIWRRIINW